jgi:hypothetical protein
MKPVLAKPGISLASQRSTLVEGHWALGWRPLAQQAPDHFFGMAEPVHNGHICPIHPELQCVTHGRAVAAGEALLNPPVEDSAYDYGQTHISSP